MGKNCNERRMATVINKMIPAPLPMAFIGWEARFRIIITCPARVKLVIN